MRYASWEKISRAEDTYIRKWAVGKDGDLLPLEEASDHYPVAEVWVVVTRACGFATTVRVLLGPTSRSVPGPMDLATLCGIPNEFTVGIAGGVRDEEAQMPAIFELAEQAAQRIGAFFAVMWKLRVGDIPEGD